ncbi:MAG: sigma-70 family RNA polymerase sigma factor [Cyclobacteriaceae bacterium]
MKPEFQDLLNNNQRIIAKICRAYTNNNEDFNDYQQECIVQLWKSFDSFRGASKVSTWVYRVCLNVCLSQLRKKKKNIQTVNSIPFDLQEDDDCSTEENIETIYKAIRLLKESDRAIILLYLDDKSYKEMAEILGITVTNVGAKVNRVKNQLKSIINERFRY